MKANINLELDKEDLTYELSNLVSEIATKDITRLVKEKAEKMIEQEIERIISPIVDNYLQNALIGREHLSYHDNSSIHRTDVNKYIERTLQRYLDEPSYRFSNTSSEMSKRYMKSSDKGSKTRAELWVNEKVIKCVDEVLFKKMEDKIEATISEIVPTEEMIEEIIKREIKNKFE